MKSGLRNKLVLPPLQLTVSEVLTQMGCPPDNQSASLTALAEEAWTLLAKVVNCRAVWLELPRDAVIFPTPKTKAGKAQNKLVLPGAFVADLLSEARSIVLYALTLGTGVERLTGQTTVTDPGLAVAVDAAASALIERQAGQLTKQLMQTYAADGLYLTEPLSPGLADFPLVVQADVLDRLDAARQIGLTVTDSSLMLPLKSVSAVLGVCEEQPARLTQGCRTCPVMRTCLFRRSGTYCGARVAARMQEMEREEDGKRRATEQF